MQYTQSVYRLCLLNQINTNQTSFSCFDRPVYMPAITCTICLEPPVIPVRLKCFPCGASKQGERSCDSITRVCLTCAVGFLQLQEPPEKRAINKKCLTCAKSCRPSTLMNMNMAFEKDFLLMSLDGEHRFKCPGWEVCNFEGNHNEVERHFSSHCARGFEYCRHCRHYIFRGDGDHKKSCPLFVRCRVCDIHLSVDDTHSHYRDTHGKEFCPSCVAWYDLTHNHRLHCPLRPVECRECHQKIPHLKRREHWEEHIKKQAFIVEESRRYSERHEEILAEMKTAPLCERFKG